MTLITRTASDVFRPVGLDGSPRGGDMGEVRTWGAEIEQLAVMATASGGALIFADLATMNASLAYAANTMAWVVGSITPGDNGIYRKLGATGAGSWLRQGDLPNSIVTLSNTNTGTANAILANADVPLPVAPRRALILLNILYDNTGPVTVGVVSPAVAPKPLLSSSGAALTAGQVKAGQVLALIDTGPAYRLATDADAAASATAAAAAATQAQVAQAAAEAAALSATARNTAQGRLTLSATLPVTTLDVAASGTLRYLPAGGSLIPIWNGTQFVWRSIGAGLAAELSGNAGHAGWSPAGYNQDVFVADVGGVLRLGNGPGWDGGAVPPPNVHWGRGSGANSTALTEVDGIKVNAVAITFRFGSSAADFVAIPAGRATYVGSIRPTANGVATDTRRQRLVYNAYNQVERVVERVETTASWDWNNAAYRQLHADPLNQVEVLFGLAGGILDVTGCAISVNSTTTQQEGYMGLGLDDAAVPAVAVPAAFLPKPMAATLRYAVAPGLGFHYLTLLERGAGVGGQVQSWRGGSYLRGTVVL